MIRILMLSLAGTALASSANAQNAPKPIPRAQYVQTVDNRFNAADTNHDGQVTKAELAVLEQRDLENAKAKLNQQLTVSFNRLDTNHDGKLSLQEFLGAAPPVRQSETPDQTIAKLDTNHDGKVSAQEFRAPEIAKFNRVDANHDGIVTPQEIQAARGK